MRALHPRRWLLAQLLALAVLGVLPAAAQKVDERAMRAVPAAGGVSVTFAFADLADRALRAKLKSGLPQTVTTRIYLYASKGREPVAIAVHSCRIVYDLWEAKYRVHVQDEKQDRLHVEADLNRVVERCFSVRNAAIAAPGVASGKPLYAAALVEVNPMSRNTVRRIRRWLARPSGDGLGGDAFFGSFVSIFVGRELGKAERSVAFRSEALKLP